MCGITGYIDYGNSSSLEVLKQMTNSLHHRGPDDGGYEIRQLGDINIGLGFRRLSIIDLSQLGHQPMVNEINGDVIVFNGEVYNYQEIRKDLEKAGHKFISNSDTEVVLRSFQHWGVRCVDHFTGMFAIVIYSPTNGKIHVFRDRPGVKPFYYYWDGTLFLFASELKAFHQHPGFKKKINNDVLGLYFHQGYIPAPYCIFNDCWKLPQGYRMEIDLKSKKITKQAYWSILNEFNKPKLDISFDEATDELEKILTKAFNYRMIADVPVGVFLSGGYDSSCVTALLQKQHSRPLKTFTISFENEAYDEGPRAKAIAKHLGTDHMEYICSEKEALELLPAMPDIYDEPLADGSIIPNVLVCQMAKQTVKVVLSADGGDEVFAGYSKHSYAKKQYERYFKLPIFIRQLMMKGIDGLKYLHKIPLHEFDRLGRIRNFLESKDVLMLFSGLNQVFTENEINRFLIKKSNALYDDFMNNHLFKQHNDEIDRIIAIDFQTYLAGDILPKVDQATSFASIEGREPLLDHKIIEFASTLPSQYKLRNGVGKSILRNVVHKYVPKDLMDHPKMGFGVPVRDWGRNELKPLFDEFFDRRFLEKQEIFSADVVTALYTSYQGGDNRSFDRVYAIFVFQQWYKRWMM